MQHKELRNSLALLSISLLVMKATNQEGKQPCAVKALTLTLALEKVNFLIDFIDYNFKTENDEE